MDDKDISAGVTPAVTQTAIPAAVDMASAPTERKRMNKWISAAGSIAAGAAITFAVKTCIVSCAAVLGAPVALGLAVAAIGVGAASAMISNEKDRRFANTVVPDKAQKMAFWNKKNFKNLLSRKNVKSAAWSAGMSLAGGLLFLGVHDIVTNNGAGIKSIFNHSALPPSSTGVITGPLPSHEPFAQAFPAVETPSPAVAAIEPAAAPCVSAIDRVGDIINNHNVSAGVRDAFERAHSATAAVAAQGKKDLAYYMFNNLGGMPKDASVAVELFKDAAEHGNVQAKIDLLYMQYHGLGGLQAAPQAAIDAMQSIGTPRANEFVNAWADLGTKPSDAAVPFKLDSVVKGVAFCK